MLRLPLMFILSINILFCYYKQDPVMIALSGAYNTESYGYHTVGINPANLAFNKLTSFNFLNINLNLQNNFLTNERIRSINGADLENIDSENYFPKEDIVGYLGGSDVKLGTIGTFPMPMLNFSSKNFSINSNIRFISNSKFSPDILDMVLDGNEIDREYDLSIKH